MKKLLIVIILTILILPEKVYSQEEKFSPFNISFIPRPSDIQYTNGASFNLLVGLSQNEKAFTFASLANIIRNDANGFQFAGLTNTIGHNAKGFQFSGLYNYIGNEGKGLQFAGLANINKNTFNGFQFAGLYNHSGEMKGFQFAGITNISANMQGFQFAGIANIAQNIKGFQFAGIVNKAKNVEGAQFGVVNIADHNDYPIGLINIIKDGEQSLGVTYDETGSAIIGLRTGGRILYGIIGIGYNHKTKDEEWVIQGGFGAHIPVVNRFRINCELTTQSMTNLKNGSKYVNKNSFSILPAFSFLPHLEIFAGPSVNSTYTNNTDNTKIFPSNNLWKKTTDKKREQIYIGYTAGIQYIF